MSYKIQLLWLSVVLAISAPSASHAEEWTRSTVNGGQITRSVTNQGGGVYSATTTRTGAKGGTYTSSSTCANGVVARCSRSYSGVGANGKAVSGGSVSANGPFRSRSVGYLTGPNGNTVYGVRRFRR